MSKVSGLTLSRLANGKVIEEYTNWDTFGMMQQLFLSSPTPNQGLAERILVRVRELVVTLPEPA